jgi:hypothetical protein
MHKVFASQIVSEKMMSDNDLITQIKDAFQDAVFPSHLGLHAAIAMDRWIQDPEILQKITQEKDYWGDWWDVPYEHLEKCGSLAFSYLDSIGVYFYLPAFMLRAIKEKTPKSLSPIITALDLKPNKNDEELYLYFCDKFKLFDCKNKKLCRDFLCFMKTIHAGQKTILISRIDEILETDFWRCNL